MLNLSLIHLVKEMNVCGKEEGVKGCIIYTASTILTPPLIEDFALSLQSASCLGEAIHN